MCPNKWKAKGSSNCQCAAACCGMLWTPHQQAPKTGTAACFNCWCLAVGPQGPVRDLRLLLVPAPSDTAGSYCPRPRVLCATGAVVSGAWPIGGSRAGGSPTRGRRPYSSMPNICESRRIPPSRASSSWRISSRYSACDTSSWLWLSDCDCSIWR